MRGLGLLSVVLVVGCGVEADTMFTHQGQVMAQARGLVISADGTEGVAGMYGTTCVFDAQSGQMGQDFDLEGDDENIEDGSDSGVVLVRSQGGIHLLNPYGQAYSESNVPTWQSDSGNDDAFDTTEMENVIAARWLGESPVVLVSELGHCGLHGLAENAFTVALDSSVCATYRDMIVDEAGRIYVGTATEILAVQNQAASQWTDVGTTAMSWDEASQAMYMVTDGGQTLQAREMDGRIRWERATLGVTALTHMGPRGALATMEHNGEGRGVLAVYDGANGDVVEATDTPSAGTDLAISENGTTLAIAADQFIHLFAVE